MAFYENYSADSEYSPVEQHNVEILQALILAIPETEIRNEHPSGVLRTEINEQLKTVGLAFAFKRLANERGLETIIRELARTGTQTVRNPGTQGQVQGNLKALFSPLDSLLLEKKGVSFSGLCTVCEGFVQQIIARINSHRKIMQRCFQESNRESMIQSFGRTFGLSESEMTYLSGEYLQLCSSLQDTKAALFHYSERVFPRMFSTNLHELVGMYPGSIDPMILKEALSVWSLKFGALSSSPIEYLFLSNPVWQKPFIELSEGLYFWPVFPSFISFGMEMLEAQIETDQRLKDAYHEQRAKFTEDKTAEMLSSFGSNVRVLRNLRWKDLETGKDLENDILVLLDTHAIIVECKSGRIKDAARRGGKSLEESLKKLIEEPTEQGFRFERFLRNSQGPVRFTTDQGITEEIDPTQIRSYTRLNILLDYWGPLACQDKLLRKIGMIKCSAPAAVSMALVDLENLLFLIEAPAQRLHYLHRRASLERTFEILGDELDLIAYYLGDGQWPTDPEVKISVSSASRKLDSFLRRRDLGLSKKVPKLKLNKWWNDLLEKVEKKAFRGWSEAAIILLSFPYQNQETYWSLVESTLTETASNPTQTEGREIICTAYPTPEETVGLATHVTTRGTSDENREKSSRAINEVANMASHPTRLLAITIFPDTYPYANLCLGIA